MQQQGSQANTRRRASAITRETAGVRNREAVVVSGPGAETMLAGAKWSACNLERNYCSWCPAGKAKGELIIVHSLPRRGVVEISPTQTSRQNGQIQFKLAVQRSMPV